MRTVWPIAQRGTSLPLAGGSHQLEFLIDPIQSRFGSSGTSLKRRNVEGVSGCGAGATAICALPISGMARQATTSNVAVFRTVILTRQPRVWPLRTLATPLRAA